MSNPDLAVVNTVLPAMSTGDVRTRMLTNLCNVYSRLAVIDPISYTWAVTPMALAAPLSQLCPAFGVPSWCQPFRRIGQQLLSEAIGLACPLESVPMRVLATHNMGESD